ncbi:MAG: hypothetical protein WCL44_06350 [bacterium]
MWKEIDNSADEFCDQLSSARNFAGAVIGDNWVATFMVHLDLLGPVYTMRWRREMIVVPKGVLPSLRDVKDTLGKCWAAMGNHVKVEYSKFFLCIPGWICRSVNSTAEIETNGKWSDRSRDRVRVDERHVRALRKKITKENLPPDSVVVDFVPGSFTLDDGRRMMDPTGAASRSLVLDAHLVVADGFWVNEVIGSLGDIGVRVDAVTSVFSATEDLLTDEEKLNDTLVINVGARHTCLSFFNEGYLSATKILKGGSDDVICKVAGNLNMPVAEVNASIAQLKLLLFSGDGEPDGCGEFPLFVWRTQLPVIRDLDHAAVPFADSLLSGIWREVERLRDERGVNLRNAIVTGDDPLVVRAVLSLMRDKTPLRSRRGVVENVHKSEEYDSPGYSQMVSMVRQHGGVMEPRGENGEHGANALVSHRESMAGSIIRDGWTAVRSYFARMNKREHQRRRKAVLRPSLSSSGELIQTFDGSRYVSGVRGA